MARTPSTMAVSLPAYQRWLLPFATGVAAALMLALCLHPRADVLAKRGPADGLEREYLVLRGDEALLRAEFAQLAARIAAERRACPAPEPAPKPPVEAKPDESLRIPEEAKRSGDMSFLAGCWASITTLVNQRTGAPIVAEYCFDENGFGRSIRTEPNTQCVGPMRAHFDDQGSLTVEETEMAVCGDGRRYTQTTVTCSPGENNIAQCTGVNRGSRDAYTVGLQRKDSRPAGGESPQTPGPSRLRP
ncbi:MAG: hypothetical protein JNM30_13595 [Rhodospirillales bacterium]|nr:hypothetical protein [Rhodospirillales bacterium]